MNDDPSWLKLARSFVGLKEAPGAADNPKVVQFFADAGHPEVRHDSVAWCAAFVGAMLKRSGLRGTGTLWALDYEHWGQKLDKPILGCIATKHRIGGGHVFFVVGANSSVIYALGGNQNDQVCVEAIDRRSVTAFRWPAGVAIPRNPPPLAASFAGASHDASEA